MTDYVYGVSANFPNGAVIPGKLHDEIEASAITIAQAGITVADGICTVSFKADLSQDEVTILDNLIAAHDGIPVVDPPAPTSPSGVPLVVPEPREGDSLVVVSHNWCDRCTWYGDSERVVGETLTTSDNLVFSAAHDGWIDLTHGRLYAEDKISALYKPVVYVDGVPAVERASWADDGDDFVVNYDTGEVLFSNPQSGHTVTADYSYENGSTFYIRPIEGKELHIEKSEVQFSQDVDLRDTIAFQPYVYYPPLEMKVPYGDPTVYKHVRDFVDEAEGVYPTVPAIGGNSGRGLSQPHVIFPFNYKTIKTLVYSYGAEIRVSLLSHKEFGGEFATASFYCTSQDE
jgi:hypothetical protein